MCGLYCRVLTEDDSAGRDSLEQGVRRSVRQRGLDVGEVLAGLEDRARLVALWLNGCAAAQPQRGAGSQECGRAELSAQQGSVRCERRQEIIGRKLGIYTCL